MDIGYVSSPVNWVSGCQTWKHNSFHLSCFFREINSQLILLCRCLCRAVSETLIHPRGREPVPPSDILHSLDLWTKHLWVLLGFFVSFFAELPSTCSWVQGTSTSFSRCLMSRIRQVRELCSLRIPAGCCWRAVLCSFRAPQWGKRDIIPLSLLSTRNCCVYQQHIGWKMMQTVFKKS